MRQVIEMEKLRMAVLFGIEGKHGEQPIRFPFSFPAGLAGDRMFPTPAVYLRPNMPTGRGGFLFYNWSKFCPCGCVKGFSGFHVSKGSLICFSLRVGGSNPGSATFGKKTINKLLTNIFWADLYHDLKCRRSLVCISIQHIKDPYPFPWKVWRI